MCTSLRCAYPFVTIGRPFFKLLVALFLALPALSLQAAILNVDCSKKSLQNEISTRLDKTAINTVNVSGNCVGNVLLSGHVNLTLGGAPGAAITGVGDGTTALKIEGSTVSVRNLAVNAGVSTFGIECRGRSVCLLENVNVQIGSVSGAIGISAQDQSAVDIIGTSVISGQRAEFGIGVGVFGASSVNIRPTWAGGFDPLENGPTITGHDTAVVAQDGAFLRTDNAFIQGNRAGVFAQRNATIKVLGSSAGGVFDNDDEGIYVNRGSTAQLSTPITGNGFGLFVGALSLVHLQISGGITGNVGPDVSCFHSTAVIQGGSCP